jgi:hypothetical protein
LAEEESEPSHSKIRIAIAIAVAAIIIFAAYYVLTPKPDDGNNNPPPDEMPIEMTTLSAKWEELSLMDQSPGPYHQFLWVEVKVKNVDDHTFDIISYEFAAEGGDGSRFNATEDDSSGSIGPEGQEIFNLSIEVPFTWAPKEMVYNYSGEELTSAISTPTPLVPDIVFSGMIHTLNDTDYTNTTYTSELVLHASFNLKNQWTDDLSTFMDSFTAKDAGGTSYDCFYKSGPDSIQPGVTGSFDLEFLVPLSFTTGEIRFEMTLGPYGSTSL